MTSSVNLRSQLIRVIFVFISLIIQCDGQTDCRSGKVLELTISAYISPTQIIVIIIIVIKLCKVYKLAADLD